MSRTVAIAPTSSELVETAVRTGGGTVVGLDDESDALVWMDPRDPDGLARVLEQAPTASWVQLPFAGVEAFTDVLSPDRTWTCAKGAYREPVAEHALALAGLSSLPERARATSWGEQAARTLYDAPVVVLGPGGVTTALLALLAPFRCPVTVVRRDANTPLPGAARTVVMDELDAVLPGAQVVGGAALDVTGPEPLPDGHPLWTAPNCLVTPHTANPWQTDQPLLSRRISDNVARFLEGQKLLGLVDLDAGY